jgi:hypothetical protein
MHRRAEGPIRVRYPALVRSGDYRHLQPVEAASCLRCASRRSAVVLVFDSWKEVLLVSRWFSIRRPGEVPVTLPTTHPHPKGSYRTERDMANHLRMWGSKNNDLFRSYRSL